MPHFNRRIALGAALAGLTLGRAGFAQTAAPLIGHSLQVQGSCALRRAGAISALQPATGLFESDRITTGAASGALLALENAARIHLGENSLVHLKSLVGLSGEIRIGGAIVFDRAEDEPPLNLTFRSEFGRIGVRGTRFFAGPTKGVFSVFVDRGEVSVRSLGTTRILSAGEGVEIRARGMAPGPVVKWGAARVAEAFASVGL